MDQTIERKLKLLRIIPVAIVSGASPFLLNLIKHSTLQLAFSQWVLHGLTILIGVGFVLLSHWIANCGFVKFQGLREFFLGEDFIEGEWFDISVLITEEGELNKIDQYAWIRIKWSNNGYAMDGNLWSSNDKYLGKFSSIICKYDDDRLTYGYRRVVASVGPPEEYGTGRYSFATQGTDKKIVFDGVFYDPDKDKKIVLFGFKILDKKQINELKSGVLDKQTAIIKKLKSNYQSQLDGITSVDKEILNI